MGRTLLDPRKIDGTESIGVVMPKRRASLISGSMPTCSPTRTAMLFSDRHNPTRNVSIESVNLPS